MTDANGHRDRSRQGVAIAAARRPVPVARTLRSRGVILLLTLIVGVGMASLAARSLLEASPTENGTRVDSLFQMVVALRQLWGHQITLNRQLSTALPATEKIPPDPKPTPVPVTLLGDDAVAADQERLDAGLYRFNRELPATDTHDIGAATWHYASGDDVWIDDNDELTADTAKTTKLAHWRTFVNQQVHPKDLGYADLLDCNSGSPCWGAHPHEVDGQVVGIDFWLDVGNHRDLRGLLRRLRVSEWSARATFCPVSRTEMGSLFTEADSSTGFDATDLLRCADGTFNGVDMTGRLAAEPGEGHTILLARWTGNPVPLLTVEGEAIVLPPRTILYNLNEVSAYRFFPAFLHPWRPLRAEDVTDEVFEGISPAFLRRPGARDYIRGEVSVLSRTVQPPFGPSALYRREADATIRIQPYLESETLPDSESRLGADLVPGQSRCYRNLREIRGTMRLFKASDAAPTDTGVAMPSLPVDCDQTQVYARDATTNEFTGVLRRLGKHTDHATHFGFGDSDDMDGSTKRHYHPALTFPSTSIGRGRGDQLAGAPTARGSLIANWLYIRHLLGAVYLAPNIGPRPNTATPDDPYDNLLAWPGMGSGCSYSAGTATGDCAFLTLEPNTLVFSERIVNQGGVTISNGTLTAHLDADNEDSAVALHSIRPYRYQLSDGDPSIGLLAQEVQGYYPEAVRDARGTLALDYFDLLPTLHRHLRRARQTHNDEVLALRSRLALLKQPQRGTAAGEPR